MSPVTANDDPRALFARAVALGTDVIGQARPDQDGVRALLGGLVGALRRMAGLEPAQVADDGWLEAWCDAAEDVHATWGDRTGGPPLVDALNDLTVRTWELAVATGQQQPAWDPHVLALAYDGARFLPGAGASPVRDDAPLIDRLVACNGRSPC